MKKKRLKTDLSQIVEDRARLVNVLECTQKVQPLDTLSLMLLREQKILELQQQLLGELSKEIGST